MILIDFSQLAIASVYAVKKMYGRVDEKRLWQYVIKSVITMRRRHTDKYGHDTVLCCDNGSWRESIFPYYKWKRKHTDPTTDIDWVEVNRIIRDIASALGKHFAFRVIDVEGAEGDDVIAVLARHVSQDASNNLFGDGISDNCKPVIVSADKDFGQLLDIADQYNQRTKKMIKGNPSLILKEQIIRGDPIDGIPNILSADDIFVTKTRQRPITSIQLAKWLPATVEQIANGNPEILARWHRNNSLINLDGMMPPKIASSILAQYEEQSGKKPVDMMGFLFSKGLFSVLDNAQGLL